MKVRVTYVIEKGNPVGLLKYAVDGELVECDQFTLDHGVLCLWKDQSSGPVPFLVKAYSPGTWRTITPVVGATANEEKPPNEDPRGQRQA